MTLLSLEEREELQKKGIKLSESVKDILRPLIVHYSLSYMDWLEQSGYERSKRSGRFGYHAKRLVAWSLVEKKGNEYHITSKGLMAYCILIDKPLDFMVERLAEGCNQTLAKLIEIQSDVKHLQNFVALTALQNNR